MGINGRGLGGLGRKTPYPVNGDRGRGGKLYKKSALMRCTFFISIQGR
jgi:hypothetical protein